MAVRADTDCRGRPAASSAAAGRRAGATTGGVPPRRRPHCLICGRDVPAPPPPAAIIPRCRPRQMILRHRPRRLPPAHAPQRSDTHATSAPTTVETPAPRAPGRRDTVVVDTPARLLLHGPFAWAIRSLLSWTTRRRWVTTSASLPWTRPGSRPPPSLPSRSRVRGDVPRSRPARRRQRRRHPPRPSRGLVHGGVLPSSPRAPNRDHGGNDLRGHLAASSMGAGAAARIPPGLVHSDTPRRRPRGPSTGATSSAAVPRPRPPRPLLRSPPPPSQHPSSVRRPRRHSPL